MCLMIGVHTGRPSALRWTEEKKDSNIVIYTRTERAAHSER